jgi:hypothetical protein
MANGAQTSVISAAMTAWQDALAARERMPNMFLIAIIAVVVLNLVYFGLAIVGFFFGSGLLASLIALIYAGVQALLLTPLAIAVHRFLLLSEINDNYRVDTQDPRFMKFLTFLAGLFVISFIPHLLRALLSSPMGPSIFGGFIGLVVGIIVAIISVRILIVFPAVAVDAPGAEWQNAMTDTKGHSWRVFFIMLCAILPAAIVVSILMMICFLIPLIGWIVGVAIQSAFAVFVVAATASAASRLYAEYANLLGRPSGLAGQAVHM